MNDTAQEAGVYIYLPDLIVVAGRDPRVRDRSIEDLFVTARSRIPQTPLICRPPVLGANLRLPESRPWASYTCYVGGCTGPRAAGHVVVGPHVVRWSTDRTL